jgi:DNA (cytosine-5)-methyltransferase 1
MRNGEVFALPTPALPTAGCACSSLLPTPHANATTGPGAQGRDGGPNLADGGADADRLTLLPTPTTVNTTSVKAQTGRDTSGPHRGGASFGLEDVAVLLPTPTVQAGSSGDLMLPSAVQPERFGPYTAAINRWEQVIGRPAPPPTEPGNNGRPRLSPKFVEWLMGLPDGWVTDVPGITRSAALKALGNGVVPQQAALALELLDGA